MSTRVVVVGAGIAGLAAAAAVGERLPGASVTVLEATDRAGGKLRLAEVAGITVDVGAEALLNRRPEAVALATAAGLADRLVHPATTSSRIWSRGRLHRVPRSVMGVPADLRDLSDTGLLSRHGAARAALEPVLPATRLEGSDVAVGRLVEERFGREVVDRLLEPMLGGVYAGHARELSLRAATPQVAALLADGRSLVRAAAGASARSAVPVFAGLAGGVGQLPGALAVRLDVRLGVTVRDLGRREDCWELLLGSAAAPAVTTADAVVLATPAPATARILGNLAPDAAAELAGVEHASSAVVTMAFRARDLPPATGSGFLVPPVEGRTVKAATFSFAKWDWVRQAGRAAGRDDLLVLRASVGRHREARSLQVDDDELVRACVDDLAAAIGLSVRPVDRHVQRWGGGLPQYAVGHLDRVQRVRQAVRRHHALAVCGAAYDGIGIAACVASARRAADEVVSALTASVR